ncbi:MAG: hypothetical protein LZ167_08295 [Thaumarchaeota archaeon]|nr:hypothetical protein [Candidatus Geocrenenecus arthurdayi]
MLYSRLIEILDKVINAIALTIKPTVLRILPPILSENHPLTGPIMNYP